MVFDCLVSCLGFVLCAGPCAASLSAHGLSLRHLLPQRTLDRLQEVVLVKRFGFPPQVAASLRAETSCYNV
jgi:hypothetical protein